MNRRAELAVVIDIQALQNPLHRDRGIGRYLVEHVDALLDAGAPIAALALDPGRRAPPLPPRWSDEDLVRWNGPQVVRDAGASGRRVVYHVPSPFEPTVPEDGIVAPQALRGADLLSVMLLDAIPMRFPEWYQRDATTRAFFRRRSAFVRCADVVLTISQHSARDAVELLGVRRSRVVVQGTGAPAFVADASAATAARADVAARSVTRPFVFTVSGWGDPRKDLPTTLSAYAALDVDLRRTHRLAVACALPAEGRRAWTAEARARGLGDDEVVFLGAVDDVVLRALYEQAAVFVLTSRYEGFGLPALEAAVCGAPVLTTDAASLPEVLDHAPSTVPVGDAAALARAITRVLREPGFAADLRAAGRRAAERHTWPAVAQRTLAAWDACHATAGGPAPAALRARERARLRVAIVGPFPPSKSGVATFDDRLALALHRRSDVAVDCFAESDDPFPPAPAADGAGRARRFPVQAFGSTHHAASYDTTVFAIGNGHYHRRALAAVRAHRGIVWLHDAQLAGLLLTSAGLFVPGREPLPHDVEQARASMRAAVTRVYGARAVQPGADDWWRTEWYAAHGYTFLEEVIERADAVVVNTRAAARVVAEHARRRVPTHLLPHPFPDLAVERYEPHTAEPLVVTLGWTDAVKRPHDLVRAVAALADRRCRLAFVGEIAPSLHQELQTLADGLGLAGRVVLTGFTDHATYTGWLAEATLVVQLRAATHGEASGALCDAIAAGRPVLTSIATADDLPEDVVARVAPDADVATLAAAIRAVLEDPGRRTRLAAAARAHAASWRYPDLAARVVTLVRSSNLRHQAGVQAGT